MKSTTRLLAMICAVAFCYLPTFSRTQQTTEQAAGNWLASLVRVFMVRNDGAWPTNWEQLELNGELTKLNERLMVKRAESFPLQAHYVFAPEKKLVDRAGPVVLIQTSPLKKDGDSRRNGRWLIVAESGDVSTQWRPEISVQTMLATLSQDLPRVNSNDVQVARKKVTASVAAKQAQDAEMERVWAEMSRHIPASEKRKSFVQYWAGPVTRAAPLIVAAVVPVLLFVLRKR